ncbi:DUF1415 domain-containing protein [Methylomonas methanica]|uniref:DUF1415 domain-containing protein n=1 Tax=Methylomonas methanica (strain DSM 25384 / MC09) TaxID=857087 RepID=F9ZYH8_METMM|nr:DUF1415 domain-containing protein [Methylomonas methanica]AEG02250.1 protein of unknown function DUF1415 [Methylomonas methanica MC09]
MISDQHVIAATQNWLNRFIIAFNICPFARREQQRNTIRYRVSHADRTEAALETLIEECRFLDENPETETTLLILPNGFKDFDDYLDMLDIAERLLQAQHYEGIYQLASFHSDYRFEMASELDQDDPANYTNRSPYPMLHIIRESSIERAVATYPDPENIPARNIKLTRELGLEKLQALLAGCFHE